MVFIHDTEISLRAAAALVNTLPETDIDGIDRLVTQADFDAYLREYPYTGTFRRDDQELTAVRANRPRLLALWNVGRDSAVPLVNAMLRDGHALPQLVIHDEFDWHIHATEPDVPLSVRMLVESAMAFVDVIRSDQWDRVRICDADDCKSVYIDFSKNRSKRYCDTGNCGNRMNVNAYRRRRAQRTA
ncbi:CGNR zinc finger domain-containing protein [Microbacterium sp.]|uniref:CGNR zinc finger domain-containing protein n=1 Tax=Microbacterium sp. TaxID=51671 RepID=UPI003C773F61